MARRQSTGGTWGGAGSRSWPWILTLPASRSGNRARPGARPHIGSTIMMIVTVRPCAGRRTACARACRGRRSGGKKEGSPLLATAWKRFRGGCVKGQEGGPGRERQGRAAGVRGRHRAGAGRERLVDTPCPHDKAGSCGSTCRPALAPRRCRRSAQPASGRAKPRRLRGRLASGSNRRAPAVGLRADGAHYSRRISGFCKRHGIRPIMQTGTNAVTRLRGAGRSLMMAACDRPGGSGGGTEQKELPAPCVNGVTSTAGGGVSGWVGGWEKRIRYGRGGWRRQPCRRSRCFFGIQCGQSGGQHSQGDRYQGGLPQLPAGGPRGEGRSRRCGRRGPAGACLITGGGGRNCATVIPLPYL